MFIIHSLVFFSERPHSDQLQTQIKTENLTSEQNSLGYPSNISENPKIAK